MSEAEGAPKVAERRGGSVRWWGSFSIDVGEVLRWKIGPMRMWLARTDREWRVAHECGSDRLEPTLAVAESCRDVGEASPDAVRVRFGFRRTTDAFRVFPALPDRPIVIRPDEPIYLPPGEESTLFVSIPLWIGIHAGSPPTQLYETPIFRPSDTWFGLPTVAGGRCYASRTRARSDLSDLELLPQRAVAVVRILNHAESELPLERLRLPSPNLSLFVSRNGQLWTEAITFEREDEAQSTSMDLDGGPSVEIGPTELVVGPRERMEKGLMRTFGGLF